MEFEFDKEIDAILRKGRGSVEAATSTGAHMDADELAAFAENAVPAAARLRFTAHLADCTRCRKILSNIVLWNSEAAAEPASSAVAAPASETRAPWYRRLLVFPQLAYTMGGAVLVFSAFFGYLIIKNLPGASNSDVSFSTDKAPTMERPAPAANAQAPVSTNASNTTATSTNSSLPSLPSAANTTAANSAPVSTGNTNAAAAKPVPQPEKPADDEVAVAVPQATPAPMTKQEDKPFQKDGANQNELAKTSPASPTAGAVSQNRAKEEEQKKDAMVSEDRDESRSDNKLLAKRKQASPKPVEKTLSVPGATRTVGGKTFNNIGGTWYDEAVGGRKQKTVRRGTRDYQKLDAGLRSIADQLGGTVVVLWGGKAYRIE